MKLNVAKDSLLKGLQKLTNIIGTKSTLPVLANVLLEGEGNTLTMTTTDLEVRITTKVEANVQEPGKTTLNAKKLLSLVSKLSEDKIVSLECNEQHHTTGKCGRDKFNLPGLADDDFPLPVDFEAVRRMKIKESELFRMVDQIYYAVSMDDSRKVLHGILLSVKEQNMTAVSTDGKRLALVEKVVDNFSGEDGDSIIPLKSAMEIKRLLGKEGVVDVEIGEKQALFQTPSFSLTTKLIEGNYPNYRQVVPASFNKKIEIPTNVFVSKLDLVSQVLSDSNAFIKLNFEPGKLGFEATSNEGEGNT